MIGCIIQARLGSSRLPKKILKFLDNDTTVIKFLINQIKYSKKLEKIVIATTNNEIDKPLIKYLKKIDVEVFVGDENNVLDRFYRCSKKFSFSTIVRITADNPFSDPRLIDKMIDDFKRKNIDFLTNASPRTFPYGTEVEIFNIEALEKIWKSTKDKVEQEHVTLNFLKNPKKFKIDSMINKTNQSFLRWTLDEKNDLKLIKIIYSLIEKRPIYFEDIIKIYTKNPEIFKINSNVKHKNLRY